MNLSMLQACIEGYQERIFDSQCIAVHQGYWAGYYQSKKPKSVHIVLEKMVQEHLKAQKKRRNQSMSVPKPEVDMDTFIQREQRRKAYLAKKKPQLRRV